MLNDYKGKESMESHRSDGTLYEKEFPLFHGQSNLTHIS